MKQIQSILSIAMTQWKHKKWSLQTGSFSTGTCFNEKSFSRETKKCGLCRQVVTKAGLTVHVYTQISDVRNGNFISILQKFQQ